MTPPKIQTQSLILLPIAAVVFLMATLNRGAAEIGFSYFRLADFGIISLLISGTTSAEKLRKIDAPGVIITLCIVLYHSLLFFLAEDKFSADSLRFIAPYVYTLYFLAGISIYYNLGLRGSIKLISITVKCVVVLGALKPVIVVLLYNLVSIRGVSLFGIYGSYYCILVPAIGYFIIFRKKEKFWALFTTLGIVALLITGSRAGFLSLFALMLIVVNFKQLHHVLIVGVILVLVVAISVEFILPSFLDAFAITTRGNFSAEYYAAMFISIFDPNYGASSFGESLSGSREHRFEMWQYVINNVHATSRTTWFGVGFSDPLVDAVFINPHNSYITFLGRGGYVGLFLFSTLLFHSFFRSISANIRSKRIHNQAAKDGDLIFDMCVWGSAFVLSLTINLGFSTVFESPMNAVPMLFFLGLTYAHAGYALRVKSNSMTSSNRPLV